MRWATSFVFAAVVAVITVGCNAWDTSTTSTGGSAGGAGGATAQCVQTLGCEMCTQCALAGPCQELSLACQQNGDCAAIDGCVGSFATCDATCQQACYAANSPGMSAFEAVANCVNCSQCPTACAGECTTQ